MEPTQASPTAFGETEWIEQPTQAAPQQAWSAATEPMLQPYRRRQVVVGLKYLLPALLVAGVVLLLMNGHQDRNPYRPTPAPPSAVAVKNVPPAPGGDSEFLSLMAKAGWPVIKDEATVIGVGHWTCGYLSRGHTPAAAVQYVDDVDTKNGDWTSKTEMHSANQAAVNAAITAYCPQYR